MTQAQPFQIRILTVSIKTQLKWLELLTKPVELKAHSTLLKCLGFNKYANYFERPPKHNLRPIGLNKKTPSRQKTSSVI